MPKSGAAAPRVKQKGGGGATNLKKFLIMAPGLSLTLATLVVAAAAVVGVRGRLSETVATLFFSACGKMKMLLFVFP